MEEKKLAFLGQELLCSSVQTGSRLVLMKPMLSPLEKPRAWEGGGDTSRWRKESGCEQCAFLVRRLEVIAPLSLCKRQESTVVRFKTRVLVLALVLAYWHLLLW